MSRGDVPPADNVSLAMTVKDYVTQLDVQYVEFICGKETGRLVAFEEGTDNILFYCSREQLNSLKAIGEIGSPEFMAALSAFRIGRDDNNNVFATSKSDGRIRGSF